VGELVAAGLDLVVSRRCGGCDAQGPGLCQSCRAALFGPICRREDQAPRLVPAEGSASLPVWAGAWYSGPVRQAITAWKRLGQRELDHDMCHAVRRVASAIGPTLDQVMTKIGQDELWVTPIPSSRRNQWRRPGPLTWLLAQAVAAALVRSGIGASALQLLRRRAGSKDQAGQTLRGRMIGRDGTTLVRGNPAAPVLLVDDVLTTGATLLDAERALAGAGTATLGAIVLAVTPKGHGHGRRFQAGPATMG